MQMGTADINDSSKHSFKSQIMCMRREERAKATARCSTTWRLLMAAATVTERLLSSEATCCGTRPLVEAKRQKTVSICTRDQSVAAFGTWQAGTDARAVLWLNAAMRSLPLSLCVGEEEAKKLTGKGERGTAGYEVGYASSLIAASVETLVGQDGRRIAADDGR